MAQYPSAPPTFTAKVTGETIEASHVNAGEDEIAAIGSALLNGLSHVMKPEAHGTWDLGTDSRRWRDLYMSRYGFFGGGVAASEYYGDGHNLTGLLLSLLGDTDIDTPGEGQFLQYDSGSGKWINADLSIPGGVAYVDDLLDVTITAVAEGDVLTRVSGVWVNQQPQGVPIGTIAFTLKSSAPAGWILFNGATYNRADYAAFYSEFSALLGAGNGTTTFTTPDASRRVFVGKAASGDASTAGATGGSWDHTHAQSAHSHAAGTLAVASHNHAAGTLVVDSHTHAVGTLAVGSHTHTAGTLAVDSHTHAAGTLAGGSHTHTFSGTTASDGSHSHSGGTGAGSSHSHGISGSPSVVAARTDSDDETDTFENVVTDWPSSTDGEAAHTHSIGADGAHTHGFSGTSDGTAVAITGATAAATPALTGSTSATIPTLSGSTAGTAPGLTGNTGSTAPAISGSTATGGADATGANNQAWLAYNCIVKAV